MAKSQIQNNTQENVDYVLCDARILCAEFDPHPVSATMTGASVSLLKYFEKISNTDELETIAPSQNKKSLKKPFLN